MAYEFSPPIPRPQLQNGTELTPGSHHLASNELRSSWFLKNPEGLKWGGAPVYLPEDPQSTLLQLRGEDIPTAERQKRSGKTRYPSEQSFGSMIFQSGNTRKIFGTPGDRVNSKGTIMWSVDLATQFPSLKLHLKIFKDGEIIVHRLIIRGNPSIEGVSYYDPQALQEMWLKQAGPICVPEFHGDAARAGRLLGVSLRFGTPKPEYPRENCVTVQMNGENDRWSDATAMRATFEEGKPYPTLHDEVVARFLLQNNFVVTVFREIEQIDMHLIPQLSHDYRHWTQVMYLSVINGTFWWFRLQRKPQLGAGNESTPPAVVPFWLVKTWKAIVGKEGLTSLMPLTWASLIKEAYTERGALLESRFTYEDLSALPHELEADPFSPHSSFRPLLVSYDLETNILDQQYGSHSAYFGWPNLTVYANLVKVPKSHDPIAPLSVTMGAFMQHQVGALLDRDGKFRWNSKRPARLIAIDIDAPGGVNTADTPAKHHFELRFFEWLQKSLINFSTPTGGRAVTALDIEFMSPHNAQVIVARDRNVAQRREVGVGMSSLNRNIMDKVHQLGYTRKISPSSVLFTRQQDWHFVTANWTERYQRLLQAEGQANAGNSVYVSLLRYVCCSQNEGCILLKPGDFKSWRDTQFSQALPRCSLPPQRQI